MQELPKINVLGLAPRLEVPLRPLALRRGGERHDAADAGGHRRGDAADHAAFPRRVAPLEDDEHLELLQPDPLAPEADDCCEEG